jgi:hypothetical protein
MVPDSQLYSGFPATANLVARFENVPQIAEGNLFHINCQAPLELDLRLKIDLDDIAKNTEMLPALRYPSCLFFCFPLRFGSDSTLVAWIMTATLLAYSYVKVLGKKVTKKGPLVHTQTAHCMNPFHFFIMLLQLVGEDNQQLKRT